MKILCAKLDITKLNLELNLDFIAKYPEAIVNFMLYENTMRSIRHYQAKLGLEFEENCNINAAYIYMEIHVSRWCQAHYMHFVKNDDLCQKYIEKWSHKQTSHSHRHSTTFRRIIKTTQNTHLRWFQYRLMYRILALQCLLFLMKVVNSAVGTSVKRTMEFQSICSGTAKIPVFWSVFVDWLYTNCSHSSGCRRNLLFLVTILIICVLTKFSICLFFLQSTSMPKQKMVIHRFKFL